MHKKSRVAQRYAKAVIDLAREERKIETVVEDFRTLSHAVEGSRELANVLASPVIDERMKEKILTEIFQGKVSELTLRFIGLMTLKGRSYELPAIIEAFNALVDEENNVIPAKITTAIDLPADQRSRIEAEIARLSGHRVRAEYHVDESLIGGFRALYGDTMIDASMRHQLDRMREALATGSTN